MPELITDNISIVETKEVEGATRLEAEYYNKPSLIKKNFLKGEKIIDYVQYGTSEDLNEELEGYPVLRLSEFDGSFIGSPSKHCNKISDKVFYKLLLKKGDILVCRTNGNPKLVGKSALVMEDANMAFASYLFRVRPKLSVINSTTLSVYLNSLIGRREIERNLLVSNQANFSPAKFRDIKVPLFPSEFQVIIDKIVTGAYRSHKQGKLLYSQAETLLLEELGIKDIDLPHDPCYEVDSADSISASRIDAEYYQPKYERVMEVVRERHQMLTIADVFDFKRGDFIDIRYYTESKTSRPYIRIKELSNESTVNMDDVIYIKDEFKNIKTATLKKGDLVIAIIGDTIGKTNLILEELEGGFCSNNTGMLRVKESYKNRFDVFFLEKLFHSIFIQLQIEKRKAQTGQPKIADKEIKQIRIPLVDYQKQRVIGDLVSQSHATRRKAKELLEEAKRKVEAMIEKGVPSHKLL